MVNMKIIYDWKIKTAIILICFFFNYMNNKNEFYKLDEIRYFSNYFSKLKNKPSNSTDDLIIKERKDILKMFSKKLNDNLTFIDTIYLNTVCNFGNCLCILNKILFYCEIVGCHNIILNHSIYWFINNTITIQTNNLSISVSEHNYFNNSSSLLVYNSCDIYYSFFNLKPEIRIHFLRDEIIHNIPKIIINHTDLYIHIRSGDIFYHNTSFLYSQPPLCFYRNILNNFKFRNIYLIAYNKKNPLIKKLKKEYPNIIFFEQSLKEDISVLINAHNIVNSISSFVNSIIH